ncbi:MAG: hypothetical protein COA82_04600 [Alkaliphilus sp.]|nr:hypothetical protein [bacterium AH-315-L21]MBN4062609.1 hypothetical protein [Alkaliphilus sp. AH-315-G20]PHS35344.1 MAG: hypothetical protein COA82_04600 [Alkaliphilus sp.]
MIGKVIAGLVSIIFIMLFMLLVATYFMHLSIKESVNMINYHAVESISTNGIFSERAYDYLNERLSRVGNYKIKLKLEKLIKDGLYDVYFDNETIIDRRLRRGDKITIYLEDRDLTLFGRLINSSMYNEITTRKLDIRINSMMTGVITKSYKDLVKGYDVISSIWKNEADENVAIFVVTKMNSNGKHYGSYTHEYIFASNLHYGDSEDERENTGENYIFDNGDFVRAFEYYEDGNIKKISFNQQ